VNGPSRKHGTDSSQSSLQHIVYAVPSQILHRPLSKETHVSKVAKTLHSSRSCDSFEKRYQRDAVRQLADDVAQMQEWCPGRESNPDLRFRRPP
jgi:hypothetical protein